MIRFIYGTQSAYDAADKDLTALYFVQDTKRIYRGEELISSVSALVVAAVPEYSEAIDGMIYIVSEESGLHLYVKGESEMVPVEGVIDEGSITSLDAFASDLLLTSESSTETVDDTTVMTSAAVKKAVADAAIDWEELSDSSSDTTDDTNSDNTSDSSSSGTTIDSGQGEDYGE